MEEALDNELQAVENESESRDHGAMSLGSPGDDQRQGIDESYIHVFLMKYVCPVQDCGGTLAPLPGSGGSQCNMCAMVRSEQDFLREMQQYC